MNAPPKKLSPVPFRGSHGPVMHSSYCKHAPPTVNAAPSTVNSAPPAVNTAPPTVNTAPPTVNKGPKCEKNHPGLTK